ncbi:MAG: hypothetical protein JGK39_32880 [Microcoleus sp. PH2017_12_PCY_D_A]|uniref:hypothetical protein n=1 Tax=Microcoleus sp. PH2017_12_PCY_D_A TaxID=2798823 RepID=UPI001D855CD2|nr:hypothetical protein [Microcoleus sp. PH2017_12_PCY_D_A]MCC3482726.1 hypothetical protein [Microcoleus sp. PH2017_12_PCY_D_A]
MSIASRSRQELLIETVKTSPGVKTEAAAIGLAAKNPILTGVTFSDRFLARYAPPQSQIIHFQSDAGGQLNLLNFEIELVDEPPDPDDFESLDAFREAIVLWDFEHSEPIEQFAEFSGVGTVETVSLESMCQWVPCDLLFETVPSMENFCPCGEVLASQCDGRTVVIRVYPDRTVRVPCYKNRVGCCSRSPPGGDAVT